MIGDRCARCTGLALQALFSAQLPQALTICDTVQCRSLPERRVWPRRRHEVGSSNIATQLTHLAVKVV